jgi:hypothetical protein
VALAVGSGVAHAQSRIQCESRDYQYQYCAVGPGAARVTLIEQRSRSACIEGRSWGWDARGVWVSSGCEGVFDVQYYASPPAPPPVAVVPPSGPGPAASIVTCESRNYQQQFCPTGEIAGATLVLQRSRAACIQGQTWGFQRNGIWVTGGCEGDFQVQSAVYATPPSAPIRPGTVVCESRNYQQQFCATGPIGRAQLVRQFSQAACIEGQTWGVARDGIWVTGGCEGEFEILTR